jgi:hypothetical protein
MNLGLYPIRFIRKTKKKLTARRFESHQIVIIAQYKRKGIRMSFNCFDFVHQLQWNFKTAYFRWLVVLHLMQILGCMIVDRIDLERH